MIGRYWHDPNSLRRLVWLFIGLMLAGCIVGVLVPAGLGWDFANFYDAGQRVAGGQLRDLYDPFSPIDGRAPQGNMGFWGTPISALFYVPMSWFPAGTALMLFKIQNVLAFAGAFAVLHSFYRRFVPESQLARLQFAALFTFLCLIYQPFWTVFRVGGQTTPTVFLLLTLALVFHTRARYWESAICIVVAVLIKPALAPAVLFLLAVSGWAFLSKMAVVLLAAGLLSVALLGWAIHFVFLDLMRRGVQTTYLWYYNSSLYILVDNLRIAAGADADTSPLRLVFAVSIYAIKAIVLATVVMLVFKSRSQPWPGSARRHFAFVMAIVFFLLWSLTLWEHYLAMLFVLLIYVVALSRYFSRRARTIVAAIVMLSIAQNLILTDLLRARFAFDWWLPLLAIGVLKSAPLLLTLLLLWGHHRELFQSYSAPQWPLDPIPGAGRAGS